MTGSSQRFIRLTRMDGTPFLLNLSGVDQFSPTQDGHTRIMWQGPEEAVMSVRERFDHVCALVLGKRAD